MGVSNISMSQNTIFTKKMKQIKSGHIASLTSVLKWSRYCLVLYISIRLVCMVEVLVLNDDASASQN